MTLFKAGSGRMAKETTANMLWQLSFYLSGVQDRSVQKADKCKMTDYKRGWGYAEDTRCG